MRRLNPHLFAYGGGGGACVCTEVRAVGFDGRSVFDYAARFQEAATVFIDSHFLLVVLVCVPIK